MLVWSSHAYDVYAWSLLMWFTSLLYIFAKASVGEGGCWHEDQVVSRVGQMGALQPFVPLGNSGTVPRGQRLDSPLVRSWAGLQWKSFGICLVFNERTFFAGCWWKRRFKKFCYVSIFCPVQEQQGVFAVFFRYSLTRIIEKSWYVRVFFFAGCWWKRRSLKKRCYVW